MRKIISLIFLFAPAAALAATDPVADAISRPIESITGIGMIIVAFIAIFYALKVARMMRGGAFAAVWNRLAVASIFFFVMEVIVMGQEFGFLPESFLDELASFLGILMLLFALLAMYRTLKNQSSGK